MPALLVFFSFYQSLSFSLSPFLSSLYSIFYVYFFFAISSSSYLFRSVSVYFFFTFFLSSPSFAISFFYFLYCNLFSSFLFVCLFVSFHYSPAHIILVHLLSFYSAKQYICNTVAAYMSYMHTAIKCTHMQMCVYKFQMQFLFFISLQNRHIVSFFFFLSFSFMSINSLSFLSSIIAISHLNLSLCTIINQVKLIYYF